MPDNDVSIDDFDGEEPSIEQVIAEEVAAVAAETMQRIVATADYSYQKGKLDTLRQIPAPVTVMPGPDVHVQVPDQSEGLQALASVLLRIESLLEQLLERQPPKTHVTFQRANSGLLTGATIEDV